MPYLTERQRDVLKFIERRIELEGVAPTLQEIASAFGFRSTASAQKHVAQLERKGYLRREKHQKRGLVLFDGTSGQVAAAELRPDGPGILARIDHDGNSVRGSGSAVV